MSRVIITNPFIGICYMQVCAAENATDEEILEVCNRENPAGTRNGWCRVARENEENERLRPVECEDNGVLNSEKRVHFIVIC